MRFDSAQKGQARATGVQGGMAPSAPVNDWALRPRYTTADFLTLLWGERVLIAAVFGVIFLVGAVLALMQPTTYEARSSLLVQLGQEYVYQPRAGDVARGATPEIDQVTQSETEIINSAPLKARVIEEIGYARIFPKKARQYARANEAQRERMVQQGVASITTDLAVYAAPKSNVIRLGYRHEKPEVAALVLNSLVTNYLKYRREVLSDQSLPLVIEQRRAFEAQLAGAESAIESFLSSNGISDFEAEKTSLNTLQTTLRDERFRVQARLREVEGRLSGLNRQMGGVPSQIDLYRDVDNVAENRLRDLRIQREELLSRYKPSARPVQEIEVQIAQLERMLREGRGVSGGLRREGANPVFQTVETDRIQLSAEQNSLVARRASIDAQTAEIAARRMKLTQLDPQYQELVRRRTALETNLRSFLAREQEQQAAQAIAQQSSDNIHVVQRALPPAKGASLRGEGLIAAFLFAALTALAVGLGRIFLRRSFATAASASRTLDLPVLATAPLKVA